MFLWIHSEIIFFEPLEIKKKTREKGSNTYDIKFGAEILEPRNSLFVYTKKRSFQKSKDRVFYYIIAVIWFFESVYPRSSLSDQKKQDSFLTKKIS